METIEYSEHLMRLQLWFCGAEKRFVIYK